jgi:hypothetical protein
MDVLLFVNDNNGTYCGEPKVGSTVLLKRKVILRSFE